MPSKSRIVLLLALGACTPERPAGAYDPVYPDAGDPCAPSEGITPCKPDASESTDEDPGDDVGNDVGDGTLPPDAGDDFDAGMVDPTNPLAKLGGRYAMRVDYYQEAIGSEPPLTLRLKTRVSNLFLTTLTPGDGVLQATEQLCLQTSGHECVENCSGWQTIYDDDLPALYAAKSKLERAWKVDATTRALTVPKGMLPLGFDADAAFTLPKNYTDANVWQAGPTDSRKRKALHTRVTARIGPAIGSQSLDCDINTAAVFATAFNGTLPNLDADGLKDFLAQVTTSGQSAFVVDASGTPTNYCTKDKLNGSSGSEQKVFVSLKRTNASACPTTATAFDKLLGPPSTTLDPPSR